MTTRKIEGYRHMTPAERDECISLYLTGATLDSLSVLYRRERTTIVRLVKRRGANRGKPGVRS